MLTRMLGVLGVLSLLSLSAGSISADVVAQSGVEGGLVVHVGCGNGKLTPTLRASDAYLVQGLDTTPEKVSQARKHVQSCGVYGDVAVDLWDGKKLPFADGVVNLIVDTTADGVDRAEVERVLAPRGVLMVRDKGDAWKKAFTQPVPKEIDEWTHYRYDPSNNNVAQDFVVDSPRTIKWVAGPEMLRHHDHLPSLNAMVTSKGRAFYIFDEGPATSIMLPPDWKLIARDAFSGVVLWKKKIDEWHPHLWPLKSMPTTLPRRLVSVGDDLFVTMGIHAPVTQLNAADGSEVKVFAGSERCEEILVKDGTLLALRLTGKGPLDDMEKEQFSYLDGRVTKFSLAAKLAAGIMSPLWLHGEKRLISYDVKTGKERWHFDSKFAPMSLATDGKQIYFHNSKAVVCLDAATGKKLWESEEVPIWKECFAWYGPSLVVHDDVVIFSGAENMTWYNAGTPKGATDTMTAFSAKDGKKLWTAPHPPSGYRSPEDLMVAQGLVWASDCTHKSGSTLNGLDPHTGEVVRKFDASYGHGFHHRCYPAKATEKYLLLSKVGINLISFAGDGVDNNHWVRGACGFGFLPANGLLYATPDPCNCYPESKLNGFVALAPEITVKRESDANRFAKGPGYDRIQGAELAKAPENSWPTYRHDGSRGGATVVTAPAEPTTEWETEIGGRITPPVIAGKRVYIASIDRHEVLALDADSGKTLWSFTAGGRVDSPPTIVSVKKGGSADELCLFGSADGSVYCLRAADGELLWRRRLAPTDERIVSKGGVESVWPVHGSVLVYRGVAYAIAGRSSFVDGGIHLFGLDPVSGEVKIQENRGFEDQNVSGMNTQPSKPDILSVAGENLFMRSMSFGLDCKPAPSKGKHIFASNGFLNDSWFHRAFWVYGSGFSGGCGGFGKTGQSNHSGRIMVADDTRLFGFGRTRYGWGSAFEYKLYAADLVEKPVAAAPVAAKKSPAKKGEGKKERRKKPKGRPKSTAWAVDSPILVRAMAKAGDRILVAGPERLYNELTVIQELGDAEAQSKLAAQVEAWTKGAQLHMFSAKDGKPLQKIQLESMPIWDGLAVANGAIYIACKDGILRCMR